MRIWKFESMLRVFFQSKKQVCVFCLPVVFTLAFASVFTSVFASPANASQVVSSEKNVSKQDFKIHVRRGRRTSYYHMEYVVTSDNLIKLGSKSELTLVNEGGHFTVYLKKDAFPVIAPNCNDNIELDMPWTKSTRLSALKKINKKRALYESLLEVFNGTKKEQKVIIELNPNIAIKNRKPLDIELTKCNVFFRTARDGYVDYLGRLR